MGSSTREKLNEVDELRAGLEAKIIELGTRLPPAVRWTKRAVAGVGGGVTLFVIGRVARRVKPRKARKDTGAVKASAAAAPVVVRGGIGAPALIGAAAIWAAVRFYELKQTSQRRGPAAVTDIKRGA